MKSFHKTQIETYLVSVLVAAGKRHLECLPEVLKYELSPLPMSLCLNGDMRKTAKSKLLQELEFDTDSPSIIHTVPSETSYIIDLMAIVHKASSRHAKTFEDLANNLSEQHIDEAYKYADHVIIVPDRYDVINSSKSF